MSLLAEQLAPLAAVTWRRRSVGASRQRLSGTAGAGGVIILLRARAGLDAQQTNTELPYVARKEADLDLRGRRCEDEGRESCVLLR